MNPLLSPPGLRPATHRLGGVETHHVDAADGAVLATDVHLPAGTGRFPTVVMRTPYGRNGLTGTPLVVQAKLFAARGYAVVVQDVRGRFDSSGAFAPMVNEVADGRRTVDWILEQPWCDQTIAATGVSYLGGTAWATAVGAPEHVRAVAVGATHSALGLPDPAGLLHPDTSLRWIQSLHAMERLEVSARSRLTDLLKARLPGAADDDRLLHLPVIDLDHRVLGQPSGVWRVWADHPELQDPFWRDGDLREAITSVGPAAHVTGWWDLFIDHHMEDIERRRAAGHQDRVVIGPWGHLRPRIQTVAFAEALRLFDRHLLDMPDDGPRVRLWVGGSDDWWRGDAWPGASGRLELAVGGPDGLRGDPPTYVYDPQRPPPFAGGRTLALDAGRARVESLLGREDVVVVTGSPMVRPVTVLGSIELRGTATVDIGHGDVWARVVEVDPSGRSTSLTDGYQRLHDAADGAELALRCHPLAHTFRPGHRVRLLLAGGAFPLHDRNLGYGEQLTGTRARPSRTRVDDAVLTLPVWKP